MEATENNPQAMLPGAAYMTRTHSNASSQNKRRSSRLCPTEPELARDHCLTKYAKPWLAPATERSKDWWHTLSTEYNTSHSFSKELCSLEVSFTFPVKNIHGESPSHKAEVPGEWTCETHFRPAGRHSSGDSGTLSLGSLVCKRGVHSACPVYLLSMKQLCEILYKWQLFLLPTELNDICCTAVCLKLT